MRIEIKWRKSTDEGYPRVRIVEVETPVKRDTTTPEDAVLALPNTRDGDVLMRSSHGEFVTTAVQIDTTVETLPTDQQCVEAIQQASITAQAEVAERERIFREQVQENDAAAVADAREFLADPTSQHMISSYRYRLDDIDPDLAAEVDIEQALREKTRKTKEAEEEKLRKIDDEKKAEEKTANASMREIEKLTWIEQHGSDRLQRQIEAGISGWPLYLHERLAADLDDPKNVQRWELDNNGEDGASVVNPSEQAVALKLTTADRLVEIELEPDRKAALANLVIQTIEFPPDDDRDDYDYDEAEIQAGIYMVYDNYRPGQHPSWSIKSVRIPVDE